MPITPYILGPDPIVPVMYPTAAAPKALAAPTAQWTYPTTYTEIVSSLPSNFVLCGISLRNSTSDTAMNGVVEVATGIATSEVTLDRASWYGQISGVVDDAVSALLTMSCLLGPHYIPSGTRIAGRLAESSAAAWSSAAVYLYGYTQASPALASRIADAMSLYQGLATKKGDRLPTTDFITLTHSGVAWTAGAWVEISASVAEDLVIEGVAARQGTTSRSYGIEFGYGAASEVALPALLPVVDGGTTAAGYSLIPSPFPLFVPKGARLVARQRATGTTGTVKVAAKVTYLK